LDGSDRMKQPNRSCNDRNSTEEEKLFREPPSDAHTPAAGGDDDANPMDFSFQNIQSQM
jgi:hypothetical protein